jgi:hypothetical protein
MTCASRWWSLVALTLTCVVCVGARWFDDATADGRSTELGWRRTTSFDLHVPRSSLRGLSGFEAQLPYAGIGVGAAGFFTHALLDLRAADLIVASEACMENSDVLSRCTGAKTFPRYSPPAAALGEATVIDFTDGSRLQGQRVMDAASLDAKVGSSPSVFRVGVVSVSAVNDVARRSGAQATAVLGLAPAAVASPFLLSCDSGHAPLQLAWGVVRGNRALDSGTAVGPPPSAVGGRWVVNVVGLSVQGQPVPMGGDRLFALDSTAPGLRIPRVAAESMAAAYQQAIGGRCRELSCVRPLSLSDSFSLSRFAAVSPFELDRLLPTVTIALGYGGRMVRVELRPSRLFVEGDCAQDPVVLAGDFAGRCWTLIVDGTDSDEELTAGTVLLAAVRGLWFDPDRGVVALPLDGAGAGGLNRADAAELAMVSGEAWAARNGFVLAALFSIAFVAVATFLNVRRRRLEWKKRASRASF